MASQMETDHPVSAASIKGLFEEQQKVDAHLVFQNGRERARKGAVLECKGTVFFSGVGKSGFISQKVSMTLVSTGTKSVFLSPTDALHGDIGIISEDDILVLVSKSGSTEELLKLVPYAKVSECSSNTRLYR
eukprot:354438-Prorocentrum_minimum.AAC.2